MGRFWTGIAIALATALTAPAAAQFVSDAEALVTAVRERDGDKATEIIASRPLVINSRNSKGETALLVAISQRDDTWTRFLLGRNASPNVAGTDGQTPLGAAARVGFTDAAELLLRLGADVDTANRLGETPLIIAVQQRQTPIIKLLLTYGADPDKTDTAAGYSARDYAKRDTRSRDILALIEARDAAVKAKPKTKPAAKTNDLDSFNLGN